MSIPSTPDTMQAVAMMDSIPADQADFLTDTQVPVPEPGRNDLLVAVEATSINPIDTKVRMRSGKQESPKILGFDAVGTVAAVGDEVSRFTVGDRVFYAGDISRQGTNAEFHVVHERIVGHAPSTLTPAEAASLPLVSLTAWESLFDRLKVSTADSGKLLVLGGSGGVPSALIQLARSLTNLHVVGTASRDASRNWVLERGAHEVIDHSRSLVGQVENVRFVFSSWTTDREEELASVMLPQSDLVLIDDPVEPKMGAFKQKAIAIHWESMFTRPLFGTPDMHLQGEILNKVADMADRGQITPLTTTILDGLSAANIMEGHRRIEQGSTTGKIVVMY